LRIAGYSAETIKTYTLCTQKIYSRFKKPLNLIASSEFADFLDELVKRGNSPYTINLYHASLKLVIEKIYDKPFYYKFPYAKRHKKLPIVLSRSEINLILNKIINSKHKLLIALAYGAGLRVSEAIDLKVKDIDLQELTIHLKDAKGKKDRITIIPEKIRSDLQNLIAGKTANGYFLRANEAEG